MQSRASDGASSSVVETSTSMNAHTGAARRHAMSSAQFARYTGSHVLPFARPGHAYGPGMCKRCGCASADCRCGCRQCRKEAKELTFTADPKANNAAAGLAAAHLMSSAAAAAPGAAAAAAPAT